MISIWGDKIKIHNPVRWWTTNVLGTLGLTYVLTDEPLVDLPDIVEYVIWSAFGVVLVRIVALIFILTLHKKED